YGRIRDLVSVQVQNGKNSAVANGIQKLVRMPTGCEWTRLGFTVTDHAANQQAWVVKSCSVCMSNGVAQLASFMDRPRRLGGDMAWDASGERELFEQFPQALFGLCNVRIEFAVSALQVGVGD